MTNEVVDLGQFKKPAPDIEGKDVSPKVEAVTPEEAEQDLTAQHAEIKQANAERITRLARFNIQPNPVLELKIRLDCLTNALMPDNLKLAFECMYEAEYGGFLEQILEELGGPKLVTPS